MSDTARIKDLSSELIRLDKQIRDLQVRKRMIQSIISSTPATVTEVFSEGQHRPTE